MPVEYQQNVVALCIKHSTSLMSRHENRRTVRTATYTDIGGVLEYSSLVTYSGVFSHSHANRRVAGSVCACIVKSPEVKRHTQVLGAYPPSPFPVHATKVFCSYFSPLSTDSLSASFLTLCLLTLFSPSFVTLLSSVLLSVCSLSFLPLFCSFIVSSQMVGPAHLALSYHLKYYAESKSVQLS